MAQRPAGTRPPAASLETATAGSRDETAFGELTVRHLAAYETITGLAFTARKRRQALQWVGQQREAILQLRRQGIGFDLGPAEVFDPRLPGVAYPTREQPRRFSIKRPTPLPENDDDIAFAPLTMLAAWVHAGAISSERLTRIYLDRLKRYAPVLVCAPVIMERQAMAAARRADKELAAGTYRGPLHGIPWGAKDLLDSKGVPTQWGAEPYLGRTPGSDATVVERLREAGAVLVAKLSLGALAMDDVWNEGMTRNPFDLEQGSSGSSAGSASAVAAGLVGFAIGSETLGSIVSPSARCGTAGLRPTFGRVPRGGAMPLCWSMDKLGPMCRGAEDTALVLAAIGGYSVAAQRRDPALLEVPFNYNARSRTKGLRIGYDATESGAKEQAKDRHVRTMLAEAGFEMVPVKLPAIPLRPLYLALLVEAAASFDELTRSGADDQLRRQTDDAWPNSLRTIRYLPAVEYMQARRLRRRAMEAIHDLYEEKGLAAYLSPGSLGGMLALSNFTGHPAITVRTGFDETGHPQAATLTGRLFDEGTLVRMGTVLEKAAGVAGVRPELPA